MTELRRRFEDVFLTAIESNNKEIHTAIPGVFVNFDNTTQLATIRPTIKSLYINDQTINLPNILNCPVAVLRAGGFSITFPIKEGDECLIVFSERSLDSWLIDGIDKKPLHLRTHDLSDGIAFPCLYNQTNKINAYSDNSLEIRSDNENILIKLSDEDELSLIVKDKSSVNLKNDGEITISSETGDNASLELKSDGKLDLKNNSESLLTILKELLDTLSIDDVDGVPFTERATYIQLASRINDLKP
jgi:hypothetical protein